LHKAQGYFDDDSFPGVGGLKDLLRAPIFLGVEECNGFDDENEFKEELETDNTFVSAFDSSKKDSSSSTDASRNTSHELSILIS
jgi:hypothetical protein